MSNRSLLAALALLGLVACEEDPVLRRLPEPEIQIDELKQKPAALVDILWVVDNSGSMVEEQQALADNFNRFITGLTVCQGTGQVNDLCDFTTKKCTVSQTPCNPPDYHIGVAATDVRSAVDSGRLRKVGLCVPSAGATPSNGKYRYCAGSNQDCAPSAMDPASDPANGVCDMGQAISFITPTTEGAVNAFSRAVRVGTGGSGLEQGIRAAAQALGRDTNRQTGQWIPPPAENAGFLRPEASLFVVFVSDEDDSSFGETSYFYRAFESLKGAGNEGVVSMSAIVGDPDLDGPSGTGTGGCPATSTEKTAAPGNRYIALSMYSRGLSSELRVCDGRRLGCQAGASCTSPVPGLPGICLPSSGCTTDQECGNFKCGDSGCARCENAQCTIDQDRFLTLLERNGIFGSICAPDYGIVLGSLGFEAAGLQRKFEITKNADCAQTVPCCDDGVAAEACTTKSAVCVKVGGVVIPNDRATGWVWEAASDAVFFDGAFVPPTDASIQISYRVSRASSSLSCTGALN
ncbi:hypothetical protein L6R52_33590 [Myxococcota bacterium]|nr:hypothetical protein [Myxococcota bacterium]